MLIGTLHQRIRRKTEPEKYNIKEVKTAGHIAVFELDIAEIVDDDSYEME